VCSSDLVLGKGGQGSPLSRSGGIIPKEVSSIDEFIAEGMTPVEAKRAREAEAKQIAEQALNDPDFRRLLQKETKSAVQRFGAGPLSDPMGNAFGLSDEDAGVELTLGGDAERYLIERGVPAAKARSAVIAAIGPALRESGESGLFGSKKARDLATLLGFLGR
jgi:hypothetical protein